MNNTEAEELKIYSSNNHKSLSAVYDHTELDELEAGFCAGDMLKIEELILYYYKRIFFNCLRIVKDVYMAEDIVNETFLKAYKYRASFKPGGNFIGWLLKISINICMDFLKKKNWESSNFISLELFNKDFSSLKKYQKYLIDEKSNIVFDEKIKREIISGAVLCLPALYRTIVTLKYYNDMNCEEISAIVNIPVGTIKAKLVKARAVLAEILKCVNE